MTSGVGELSLAAALTVTSLDSLPFDDGCGLDCDDERPGVLLGLRRVRAMATE